jgi:hypothetical protein
LLALHRPLLIQEFSLPRPRSVRAIDSDYRIEIQATAAIGNPAVG